jgi:hypothetical protein
MPDSGNGRRRTAAQLAGCNSAAYCADWHAINWRNTLRYSAQRGWLVKPLIGAQSCLHDPGQPGPDDALDRAASIMIRNGLYLAETRFLDGVTLSSTSAPVSGQSPQECLSTEQEVTS